MVGKKILVADDSVTIQKVIRLALSNEGYEIQTVSDGNEAIQQISLFRPDAVLIDVSLPGKDAFEVKRAINEASMFEGAKFILMASAFEKIDEEQEREAGFQGRLTKPFDPAHLRRMLAELLNPHGMAAAPAPAAPKKPKAPEPPAERRPDPLFEMPEARAPEVRAPSAPPPIPKRPAGMAPEDEIISTAPPKLDQLWDETPAPQAPRAPEPPTRGGESDIRQLTESTLRMSGLDQPEQMETFEWSVNDSAHKLEFEGGTGRTQTGTIPELPEATPKPVGEETFANLTLGEPRLNLPPRMAELDHASFYHNAPPEGSGSPGEPVEPFNPLPPPPPASPRYEQPRHDTSAADHDAIRAQVEQTVEEMVRQILPEVAEKVIKQEIRRLLAEQPH